MKSNYKAYNFEKSLERIDAILNSSNFYENNNKFPNRDDLTFTNGYYVNVTSLFIDLRDSSKLPEKHKTNVLAKIYRSYISEVVAIINGNVHCREVNIVGDCVSAIFETPKKADVDTVLETAAQLDSLIEVINYKLRKKSYTEINAGIGASFGRILMIKAGYSGSTINDIVYMGEAVNKASKACSKASKENFKRFVVTPVFYNNLLKQSYKDFFSHTYEGTNEYYHTSIGNSLMNKWLKDKNESDS
jgi:class 3 adenylate cyclase